MTSSGAPWTKVARLGQTGIDFEPETAAARDLDQLWPRECLARDRALSPALSAAWASPMFAAISALLMIFARCPAPTCPRKIKSAGKSFKHGTSLLEMPRHSAAAHDGELAGRSGASAATDRSIQENAMPRSAQRRSKASCRSAAGWLRGPPAGFPPALVGIKRSQTVGNAGIINDTDTDMVTGRCEASSSIDAAASAPWAMIGFERVETAAPPHCQAESRPRACARPSGRPADPRPMKAVRDRPIAVTSFMRPMAGPRPGS